MKIKPLQHDDVVSIERVVVLEPDDADEEMTTAMGELDHGTYAIDSCGRVWRLVESVSGLIREFTESDGIKRRRAKRAVR